MKTFEELNTISFFDVYLLVGTELPTSSSLRADPAAEANKQRFAVITATLIINVTDPINRIE